MARTIRKLLFAATSFVLMGAFNLTADEAFAQIRPAYTKNLDEPGRIPYQHIVKRDASLGDCEPDNCRFNFPVVPAGKRLIVEHISAYVEVNSPDGVVDTVVLSDTADSHTVEFWVQPTFVPGGYLYGLIGVQRIMDRAVRVYFEPGQTPRVFMTMGPNSYLQRVQTVTLHGYLIDAAN